ncbi:ABC transporter substrate-binding protein [Youngiibacter fragilis]|uniref:Peptide ABC transporter substrate-binding protein n=1 Tax=Youngiibacter fragilis 232.1 TaxID=994573 RepID=V7IAG3_9CLOT|nr:ABC transporter substrate-binding protein [Youngiibacter fragilis]ETA82334.1 peptide ABC transporter substrate-binding protein [Youngiibacter fragilis 232.1]
MKKILVAALAAMMAVTALTGCGNKATPTTPVTPTTPTKAEIVVPGTPTKGGVLTVSLTASPKNLDPVKYTGTYESQIIQNVGDTLVSYKMDLSEVIPNLAKEWSISEDGKAYTFKLRDDVFFHPGKYQTGRKMVAEDIKYSLERSFKLSAMKRLDMIESVEVVNDYEVIVHLPEPNAVFLTALTNSGNIIVPKEEVEGWGDEFGNHLVGTGPFMMKEFKLDEEAVLVRNEKYWAQVPHLDGVTFKVITDMSQNANALRTGEVDFASGLTGEAVKVIREDANVKLLETPGLHVAYIYFNQVSGPTKDKKVREALIKAVDINELVKGVYQYGEAKPAALPLPPGSWGYDESLVSQVPTYDPAAAKKLLAEAGYADGFKTTLYISNTALRIKMGTILQQYFKTNLNVDLDVQASEWGTFSEIASKGNAEIFAMSWTWYPDPFFFLNKIFASSAIGSLGNGQGYSNPEVDKLLADALIATDQDERATMYKKALKLIVDDLPGIFYANENVTWGISPYVQGVVQRADGSIFLCNTEVNAWKVAK